MVRSGLLARLATAGLAGRTLEPERLLRASLMTLGCALAAFLTFGIAIWSQLTIGWQWAAPTVPATTVGMIVMSAAGLGFILLAPLAAIPITWALGRALRRGDGRGLLRPALTAAAGAAVLVVGSIHFGHGWPGTGGHPWSDRGLVPDPVARFGWAATLWITSYWAHPSALSSFPGAEITWMLASPLALLAILIGSARTASRLTLSPRVLRFEARLGVAAAAAMAAFCAGAGSWVISGGPAPRGLFRVGAIDGVGLLVMVGALIVAFRSLQRALGAGLPRSG